MMKPLCRKLWVPGCATGATGAPSLSSGAPLWWVHRWAWSRVGTSGGSIARAAAHLHAVDGDAAEGGFPRHHRPLKAQPRRVQQLQGFSRSAGW